MPQERIDSTIKREQAIGYLMTGMPVTQVAELCGISRQTLWHWTQRGDFAAELKRRQIAVRRNVYQKMTEASDEAVSVLVELLRSEDQRIQLRAACEILDRVGLRGSGPVVDLEVPDSPTSKRSREDLVRRIKERVS